MWSRCFKALLLKYSRSYCTFLYMRSKFSPVNPFQFNLAHINRIHKFSVCDSLAASNKINEPHEKTQNLNFSRRRVKQISVREFLKKIDREENYFDSLLSVERAIDTLDKALEYEQMNKREIESVLRHGGFLKFVKALDIYMSELPTAIDDKLIKVLKIYRYLGIPYSNPKCWKIISMLEERWKFLSFADLADFYMHLSNSKAYSNFKLLCMMEEKIIKDLENGIHNKSTDFAALSLIICNYHFVPNEIREDVLKGVLELPDWNNFAIYKYFIQVLGELGTDHPSYKYIKGTFFEKLKIHPLSKQFGLAFLTGYVSALSNEKIDHYDGKLIDDIVNNALKNDLTGMDFLRIVRSLHKAKHVNSNFLEYILGLLQNNTRFFKQGTWKLLRCIEILADTNHDDKEENRWDGIQPLLQNLVISCNYFQDIENSSKDPFGELLHSVVRLAALGVYSDESLQLLSSHINSSKQEIIRRPKPINLVYMIGLLHQAVRLFHPSFDELLVNKDVLLFIVDKLSNLNTVPTEKREMLLDMKEEVYKANYKSGGMLLNIFTKCGMLIDGVVAMNDEGDIYLFQENEKKCFIEDISVPKNYELIVVLAFSRHHYSRNTRSLMCYCSLNLKVLRAMGYKCVCVYEDDLWNERRKNSEGQYLLNKIREKRCGRLLGFEAEGSSIDSGE